MITDIHSHTLGNNTSEKIISLCMRDCKTELFLNAKNISVGIHPWYLTEYDIDKQIKWVSDIAEKDKRVAAIGECGTDSVCSTPMNIQISAFTAMIKISEDLKLPLIIHSVKTLNNIISLKNQLRPTQKWIIHGFRGKKEAAVQLASHGIFISLGEKFNKNSLEYIPKQKLLIETDESTIPINKIAENLASSINIKTEELIKIVSENANSLFFNR